MSFELFESDIRNRLRGAKVEVRDAGTIFRVSIKSKGKIIAEKLVQEKTEGVKAVRDIVLDGESPNLLVTTQQRNKAKNIVEGQQIFNTTTNKIETYYDGKWE
jgi:hypothetical protein